MNDQRVLIFTILFILLPGCTTYHRPTISAPKSTRSGVKFIQRSHDLSQMKWWNKMHDPVLNHLIQEALVRNNQILNARANVLQAQAKLKEAHFAWVPTLDMKGNGFTGGGWDSQVTPQGPLAQNPIFTRTGSIHFRGYYAGFIPKYSLNILANMSQDKFAQASLDMQQATYQSTRLSIISQVSGSYFMLLGQKAQLALQQQQIHDLKEMRRLEWTRFKDGASDLSTITSLDQQIGKNEANLSGIKNSIAQTENALQILLNRNPGPIETHKTVDRFSVKGLIPPNLPSAVLKNRPDVMMAEANLKMSSADLGTAYSNFFPTISLTSLLGGASFQLSHLLKLSTGLWVAQAAASMPVLNGANYEQIQAAKAAYQATYFSYVQTLRSAFADVDNSLTNLQTANEAYHYQVKAVQAAEKAQALAMNRYRAGAKDYRDVVNAKLNVDAAKLDLILAKMQQLDAIVGVYQAVAGGYRT